MKVYRCPKNCTVSDQAERCPRCGNWLKYDGDRSMEEIEEKTKEYSVENAQRYGKWNNK
jgi:transcription initiation factor IIE alpha subunit